MGIYVIIPSGEQSLDLEIKGAFPESDRYRLPSGVWFVRSKRLTSSDVVSDVNIKIDGKAGIVASLSRYNGVADRALIEKLQVWEQTPWPKEA